MADKSLGQHWLFDVAVLEKMCDAAEVSPGDTVLEIGPGLGTLTHHLLKRGAHVAAVEFDKNLVPDLENKFAGKDIKIVNQSITEFDFSALPMSYKIVANIPYYLTSHLLRMICETPNSPTRAALLVQKEVAERVAAVPGDMSLLAVGVQVYAEASLGDIIPAGLFSPPPKVDSRILSLSFYDSPQVSDTERFFRTVKAGFSNPRKKLRSSLAAGLHLHVKEADEILSRSNLDGNRRAQTLSISEWSGLAEAVFKTKA